MSAGSAEAGLDFIGDTNAARGPDMFINMLEIAVRENDDAANSLDGFSDEPGHLSGRSEVDELLDVRGVLFARLGIIATIRPAVGIGGQGVVRAEAVRNVEFPG